MFVTKYYIYIYNYGIAVTEFPRVSEALMRCAALLDWWNTSCRLFCPNSLYFRARNPAPLRPRFVTS